MSNQLAVRHEEAPQMSWQEIQSIGQVMFQSGLFKDLQNQAQAIVKVIAGREYGMEPFSALQNVHLIQGKPTLAANAMAMAVKKSGKYDYRVLEMTDKACEIEFFEAARSIGKSRFDLEDAKRAQTQNLQKFARNMMFARCISNGVRWYCPDVFSTAVYTPEEVGAVVDGDGAIINTVSGTCLTPTQEEIDASFELEELQSEYETLRATAAQMGMKNAKGDDFIQAAPNWTAEHYRKGISLIQSRIQGNSNSPKPQTLSEAVHAKGVQAAQQTPEEQEETERIFGDVQAVEGEIVESQAAIPNAEPITEAQRGAILSIANKVFGADTKTALPQLIAPAKAVSELSKDEATALIDKLRGMQEPLTEKAA